MKESFSECPDQYNFLDPRRVFRKRNFIYKSKCWKKLFGRDTWTGLLVKCKNFKMAMDNRSRSHHIWFTMWCVCSVWLCLSVSWNRWMQPVWTCACITVVILHFSSCSSRYDSNMHNDDSYFVCVAIAWPSCTSFLFLRLFNKPLISSAMQCPVRRCTKHHHQQRWIISRPEHRSSKML